MSPGFVSFSARTFLLGGGVFAVPPSGKEKILRKKLLLLLLAFAALAGAGMGLLSPEPADAACPRYCCPDTPTHCITCCNPRFCELNCP